MRSWFAQGVDTGPALFALLLFLVLFVAAVAWVMRPGARKRFERLSRLPLEDDAPRARDARNGSGKGDSHG